MGRTAEIMMAAPTDYWALQRDGLDLKLFNVALATDRV